MARLWFKRRTYGWGWAPATIEGWAIVTGHLALTLLGVAMLRYSQSIDIDRQEARSIFIIWMVAITAALIAVCYRKGETSKWQWGGK